MSVRGVVFGDSSVRPCDLACCDYVYDNDATIAARGTPLYPHHHSTVDGLVATITAVTDRPSLVLQNRKRGNLRKRNRFRRVVRVGTSNLLYVFTFTRQHLPYTTSVLDACSRAYGRKFNTCLACMRIVLPTARAVFYLSIFD